MSQPYLGQIEAFAFGFAPKGWQPCQGQLLPIQQNPALFSLLGTTYGGNGTQTFALPDLRGRAAMGQGAGSGLTSRTLGQSFGEESHTILLAEVPTHNHMLETTPTSPPSGNVDTPGATVLLGPATAVQGSNPIPINPYIATPPAPTVTMSPNAVGQNNGGQPHANMMPFLVVEFCIAIVGIFPTQN